MHNLSHGTASASLEGNFPYFMVLHLVGHSSRNSFSFEEFLFFFQKGIPLSFGIIFLFYYQGKAGGIPFSSTYIGTYLRTYVAPVLKNDVPYITLCYMC